MKHFFCPIIFIFLQIRTYKFYCKNNCCFDSIISFVFFLFWGILEFKSHFWFPCSISKHERFFFKFGNHVALVLMLSLLCSVVAWFSPICYVIICFCFLLPDHLNLVNCAHFLWYENAFISKNSIFIVFWYYFSNTLCLMAFRSTSWNRGFFL